MKCKGNLENDVGVFFILSVRGRHEDGTGEMILAAAAATVKYVVLAAESVFYILRLRFGICFYPLHFYVNGGLMFLFRTISGLGLTYKHFILLQQYKYIVYFQL